MVANFGAEATSTQDIQSAAPVTEGVSTNAPLLTGLGSVFDQAQDVLKVARKSRNTATVADFTKQQLLVADALDQGKFDRQGGSAFARTRARQNLLKAIDANPLLTEDLVAAHKSILGLAAGGKVIDEGTREEQRIQKRDDQLIGAGLVAADANEETFTQARENAQLAVAAEQRYKGRIETLDLQLKLNTLTTSQRTSLEAERKTEANRWIRDSVPAQQDMVRTAFERIIASDATESEKTVQINDFFTQWRGGISTTLGEANTAQASAMLEPFNMMHKMYLDRAQGLSTDAEVERNNKRITAAAKAYALAQPGVANIAAARGLLGEQFVITFAAQASQEAMDALLRTQAAADPNSGIEAPPAFTTDKALLEGMRGSVSQSVIDLDSSDPNSVKRGEESIKSFLTDLEEADGRIRSDPIRAKGVMDWFGSQAFLRSIKAHPDAYENLEGVKEVLSTHYDSELKGMVRREFVDNDIMTTNDNPDAGPFTLLVPKVVRGSTATQGNIEAVTTNSGMRFVMMDGVAEGDRLEVAAKVANLNKTLSPIINNFVRSAAHLNASDDYAGQWESMKEEFMAASGVEPAGGDTGDDLDVDDFSEDKPQPVIKSGSNKPLIDSLEGASSLTKEGADVTMGNMIENQFAALQTNFGSSVIINDAIAKAGTSRERNTRGSRHFHGDALDLSTAGMSDEQKIKLVEAAKKAGFTGFGFGNNILHVDLGASRGWAYGNSKFGGEDVSSLIKRIRG